MQHRLDCGMRLQALSQHQRGCLVTLKTNRQSTQSSGSHINIIGPGRLTESLRVRLQPRPGTLIGRYRA